MYNKVMYSLKVKEVAEGYQEDSIYQGIQHVSTSCLMATDGFILSIDKVGYHDTKVSILAYFVPSYDHEYYVIDDEKFSVGLTDVGCLNLATEYVRELKELCHDIEVDCKTEVIEDLYGLC